MATIVCQGLQSCLESHLVDLRFNFSSSKPHFSQPLELALKSCFLESNTTKEVVAGDKCHVEENTNSYKPFNQSVNQTSSNPDLGGWSFLQTLPNSSQGLKETMEEDKTTYVHPLLKRSKSMLSDKSLELCTENLGNETGTDIVENSIFSLLLPSSDSKGGNLPTREQQKSRQLLGAKTANQTHHHRRRHHNHNFPPPLTTISGSESLQVRPHREDGRLIIKAVKVPAKQNCFQAERSHGRLRLCFLKSSTPSVDSEEENEASTEVNGNFGFDNDANGEKREVEEDFEDNTEKDVHTLSIDEDDDQIQMDEAISLSSGEAEIEMEMEKEKEKFERPRRCKECEHEKKGLLNWEPMWVATS